MTQKFADVCILADYVFTLSIPPTWRSGFMLCSVRPLYLVYIRGLSHCGSRAPALGKRRNRVKSASEKLSTQLKWNWNKPEIKQFQNCSFQPKQNAPTVF